MRTISRWRWRRSAAMKAGKSVAPAIADGEPPRHFAGVPAAAPVAPSSISHLARSGIAHQGLADEIAGGEHARQRFARAARSRFESGQDARLRAGVSAVAHRMSRGRRSRARTLLEMPLADAAQRPTILAMKTRIALMPAVPVRCSRSLPAANKNACAKSTGPRPRWRAIPRSKSLPPTKPPACSRCAIPPTARCTSCNCGELIAAPPPPKVAANRAAPPRPRRQPRAQPRSKRRRRASEPAASQTTETVLAPRAGTGESLAEGPGYSISRGARTRRAAAHLEGPGYSITRDEPARSGRASAEAEAVATSKSAPIPSSARATG